MGSKLYAVLTVGKEGDRERVVRASRVSDDFVYAEVANETHTYRLSLYADGDTRLEKIPVRWDQAQDVEAHEGGWHELWFEEDTVGMSIVNDPDELVGKE